MRVLLIKLKHIGDCLLMTPTIAAIREKYPEAVIWCVVRKGSEKILAGCPGIDRVLTAVAPEPGKRGAFSWLRDLPMALKLRSGHFDVALELTDGDRGRWLSLISGAKKRATNTRYEFRKFWKPFFQVKSQHEYAVSHRVEKDFAVAKEALDLGNTLPPLQFSREKADFSAANTLKVDGAVFVHPATRWKRKQWPVERWAELCKRLSAAGHSIVLSCGPDEEERAHCREILRLSGVKIHFTEGKLSWAQMAGVLFRARLFIGVDTAAMHLAAACQTPIIALFGPSIEKHWSPWACRYELVTPDVPVEKYTRPDGYADPRLRKMEDISLEQVWASCGKVLGTENHPQT